MNANAVLFCLGGCSRSLERLYLIDSARLLNLGEQLM